MKSGERPSRPTRLAFNRKIGAILRKFRKDAGLSRKGACARVPAITPNLLSRYEQGREGVPASTLFALVHAYGGDFGKVEIALMEASQALRAEKS